MNPARTISLKFALFFSVLVLVGGCKTAPIGPTDAAWYKTPEKNAKTPYSGLSKSSRYLTMRDGVKIAVDVYLPKPLKPGEKIPTILHQTRYWRSVELTLLGKLLLREPGTKWHRYVKNGYAVVSVDVRGSGASFGTWLFPWSPDEVKDGAEIVDWIINQPWSNGKVGTTGVSYDGSTAEFLLVNKHPAVKAALPRFALFDAYTDIAFPGGIHLKFFTEKWQKGNDALDRNAVEELAGAGVKLFATGVSPVQGPENRALLADAIHAHRYNGNIHEGALTMSQRDNHMPYMPDVGIDTFSPYTYRTDIEASGAAVYSYSGWFDGGYPHAAIKRYLTLKNPNNRLILGPWNHGGSYNCSPANFGETKFSHRDEILRFFDYHLKGIDTGLVDEKPIHYYTMVAERWNSADTWPPEAETRTYYFAAENRLSAEKPSTDNATDTYTVDYTAGTGDTARWNTLLGGSPVQYPDRRHEDEKLLCYDSAPLENDTEVTGHPIVTLHVSSTAKDGNFFVYLEDIDESGQVTYVTEGLLRALHRKISDRTPPYTDVVPYRTFEQADAELLTPGRPAELVFDLLPTSYLFKAGHRIRVAVAGADKDHFVIPPGPPPTIQIHRTAVRASHIDLPVVSFGIVQERELDESGSTS